MKRKIHTKLIEWKGGSNRKPLVLKGARQVGKTYLITEFGRENFGNCHVFNFEEGKDLHRIFEKNLEPKRICEELSFYRQIPINTKEDLVFFDEIQECPKALTSLKYFCEDMPELALISAGSLLGIKLSEESFPVGKVDFLHLYPMNFEEFLSATGNQMLIEAFLNASTENAPPETAHQSLWKELVDYYVTGGMPQVVQTYINNRENRLGVFEEVRKIQRALIDSFHKDFAKHSGKNNSIHIVSVFENIPMQLSQEIDASTKRFRFNSVIPGKRSFAQLQGPIDWLEHAGLIIKVLVCNRAEIPLKAFCKNNIFKLFIFDIGLLGAMLNLPVRSILDQDYGITKGYLAENFVVEELLANGNEELYSWEERNSEIEFLKYVDGEIAPIEVKAGNRTHAKSLQQFLGKYSPKKTFKLSAKNIFTSDGITNLPLYLAGKI